MKSIYVIFCISLLLCQSLVSQGQNASFPRPASPESLTNDFQKRSLNNLQLEAFEARGKQKLQDFFDYCSYYFGEEIEENLELHLRQQITNLFYADSLECLGSKGVVAFLDQKEYDFTSLAKPEIVLLAPFVHRGDFFEGSLGATFKESQSPLNNIRIQIRLLKS
ncbi:MAG: hypothetical protein AAF696_35430, partial [Bacteroidota bacterium]